MEDESLEDGVKGLLSKAHRTTKIGMRIESGQRGISVSEKDDKDSAMQFLLTNAEMLEAIVVRLAHEIDQLRSQLERGEQ